MGLKVIVRVDDISDKYGFLELRDWFIVNFPQISVAFYVENTDISYKWGMNVWDIIKKTITEYKWQIGGHTRSHPHLPRLTINKLKEEIINNIQDIEDNLESVGLKYKVSSFAYPFGEFDDRVKQVLKDNGIIHGLTYESGNDYESQSIFPIDNLYEIGISCNASNSVDDWNSRFKYAYEGGDIYILCLHTSHWIRGRNREFLKRIFKSRSVKELTESIKNFIKYIFKRSSLFMWNNLKEHLEFILQYSDIHFITFKDLIK